MRNSMEFSATAQKISLFMHIFLSINSRTTRGKLDLL